MEERTCISMRIPGGNRNVVNRSRCDRIYFVCDLSQIMLSSLFNFLG